MQTLRVKGWHDFQHYKGRRPPWIKLHRQLLDDFDFHCLPLASKALAPLLWLLASEYEGGAIPWVPEQVAFRMRVTQEQLQHALAPLIVSGFFSLNGVVDDASNALAEELLAGRKHDASPEESRVETERETEERKNDDDSAREAAPETPAPTAEPVPEPATARRSANDPKAQARAAMPDRWRPTLDAALRASRNPDALAAELVMQYEGLHGRAYSWDTIGQALHEIAVAGADTRSAVIATFCRRIAQGPRDTPDTPTNGDSIAAAVERLDRERAERIARATERERREKAEKRA